MKVIVHAATGEFRDEQGRFLCEPKSQGWRMDGCPPPSDPAYAIVEVPSGTAINPRTQKWSGSAVVARAQADIDATDAAQLSMQIDRESLTPPVLAMLGTIVRGRDVAAWTGMTFTERKTTILNEAAVWKSMREFFDKGA